MGDDKNYKTLHIAMTPFFAFGHMTPFLHLANKLAKRGYKISFFIPKNTQPKLNDLNLYPHLISFIPINVPHVEGLPLGSETTHDVVAMPLKLLLMKAMDLTQPFIEASFTQLKPQFVIHDFRHWMPQLAHKLGIMSLHLAIISPATIGYLLSPERNLLEKSPVQADFYIHPPPNFPNHSSGSFKLSPFVAKHMAILTELGLSNDEKETSLVKRHLTSLSNCDAIVFKTCKELEGHYCNYIETQFGRPVLMAGPGLPHQQPNATLEERWVTWLNGFKLKSVIYCALGSECVLKKDQFEELLLGLELSGMPFMAALKPPEGAETVESAMPEGFGDRVKGRGVVHGGWVQQVLILNHPSVGCFMTHCGSGSMTEALCSETQLVLLPNAGDQYINAKLMSEELKVGVEIQRGEEDGMFTKEGVSEAVRVVMDEESELGQMVRRNHDKWRQFLLTPGLEDFYVDEFVQKLHSLLSC